MCTHQLSKILHSDLIFEPGNKLPASLCLSGSFSEVADYCVYSLLGQAGRKKLTAASEWYDVYL
jgi:hypothetical protein